MRYGMGLVQNEYGVFHVRRKVPKALEVAIARVTGAPKERVSWLKKTLGTKDEKQAPTTRCSSVRLPPKP